MSASQYVERRGVYATTAASALRTLDCCRCRRTQRNNRTGCREPPACVALNGFRVSLETRFASIPALDIDASVDGSLGEEGFNRARSAVQRVIDGLAHNVSCFEVSVPILPMIPGSPRIPVPTYGWLARCTDVFNDIVWGGGRDLVATARRDSYSASLQAMVDANRELARVRPELMRLGCRVPDPLPQPQE